MPTPAPCTDNTSAFPADGETQPLLLTDNQVAELLQISRRSVWRSLKRGELVPPVRIGGAARWRRRDIERWIAEGCPACPEVSEDDAR